MINSIREELHRAAEPEYAAFSRRLLPETAPLLGVRLPKLRAMAKRIAKENAEEFLDTASCDTFEEIMLQGMVIGAADLPLEDALQRITEFLPKIDNWSVCDSFCCGLKIAEKEPDALWAFIVPLLTDERPYFVRFAAVMLLDFFIDEAHVDAVLSLLSTVRHPADCAVTAAAWAYSVCCARFPQRTIAYLAQAPLCLPVFSKTVQKCCESRRVSLPDKALLRQMLFARRSTPQ